MCKNADHDLFKARTTSRYLADDSGFWTRLNNQTFWDYVMIDQKPVVAIDDRHLAALGEKFIPRPTAAPLLPADTKGKSLYGVGAFHSMHCIVSISPFGDNESWLTPTEHDPPSSPQPYEVPPPSRLYRH